MDAEQFHAFAKALADEWAKWGAEPEFLERLWTLTDDYCPNGRACPAGDYHADMIPDAAEERNDR